MPVDRSRLPELGPIAAFHFPAIARHRLANGLDVRTVEHASAPVVAMVLMVRGGLGADPPAREGLAALTTDLTDEGVGELSALDVSEALARVGADYHVEVGADSVSLSLVVLARFARQGAELMAGIATRPALREDDFLRIRQQRLDRLKQLRTVPQALAESAFDRILYGSHPYGHLAIGSAASLGSIECSEVREFHRLLFQPEHATLVVVGDSTHDALRSLADEAFGAWTPEAAGRSVPVAAEVAAPERPSVHRAVIDRGGAAQSELRIGQLITGRNNPDYSPLLVMNAVLGGQFVSRINLKLREEKGLTYGAFTGFDWHIGASPFTLEASVHTASTAEAVAESLRELADVRSARPPTQAEMELAKASLTRGYPRGFETAEQVARSVASLALYGLPDSYFEEFVPKVSAVTADDVARVASRYIDPSGLTTLIVGDYAAIGSSLEALGLGEWKLLPPEL